MVEKVSNRTFAIFFFFLLGLWLDLLPSIHSNVLERFPGLLVFIPFRWIPHHYFIVVDWCLCKLWLRSTFSFVQPACI